MNLSFIKIKNKFYFQEDEVMNVVLKVFFYCDINNLNVFRPKIFPPKNVFSL